MSSQPARSFARYALAAVLGTAVPFWALAQDEGAAEPAAADPSAEAAAEPAVAGGESAEAPAPEVKPRPAEIMPLAPKSLLLDVTRVGDRYLAVGDRGHILLSQDGAEWKQVPVPVRAALTAVAFADDQHGWAVGHDAAIVATTDGGNTWTLQHFDPALEKPFMDVLFLDAQRGFAVGAYGLLKATTDGGANWTDVEAPSIREEELHFNGIVRLGNGDLFIAGETGTLGLSTDEGRTWKKVASPYESTMFGAVPMGEKGVLIYGLRGNVYVATDARAGNWKKLETGTVASMFGGAALPDGRVALVGLNGVVLLVEADGSVAAKQTDAGTPLAGAIALDGRLLLVGESGVQTLASN